MSRELSIRHVVRQHAEAPTQENAAEFYVTPAQACLMFWALWLLERELRKPIPMVNCGDMYADDLRCYADAIDWVRKAKATMTEHAHNHSMEWSQS